MAFGEYGDDLDRSLRLIETCKFNFCLSNVVQAKKDGISAIKILNNLLKKHAGDTEEQIQLKRYCEEALQLYQSLDSPSTYSLDCKLKWLGSKINDDFFPPITTVENQVISSHYHDSNQNVLRLSQRQSDLFIGHQNISKTIPFQDWSLDTQSLSNLYQDFLENCSFVSAVLSITLADPKLVLNSISPHHNSGKYGVSLNVNGCTRLVTIDDRFPILKNRTCYMKSSTNSNIVWPMLIEKAYLKLMGHGYDFIGSNFSTDAYILTGWIPETMDINNGKIDNWDLIFDFFHKKLCIMGVGTTNLSISSQAELKILSEHDYSIVDLKALGDDRQILIKNPLNSSENRLKWYKESELYCFKTLYINWNSTKLFKYKDQINFIYKNDMFHKNYYGNPQFTISNPTSELLDIWLLLERHVPAGISKQSPAGSDDVIAMHVFETNGERVLTNQKFISRGSYTNSRLCLSKFAIPPKKTCTILILSLVGCNFTLTSYNNVSNLKIEKCKWEFSNNLLINDEWNFQNCGGNWSNSTYIKNPQYNINIVSDTVLNCCLFSRKAFINYHLFHSSSPNDPLTDFDKSKVIINEKYALHNQINKISLKPGNYKLILSTYEKNVSVPYWLFINSSNEIKISKVSTSLGLFAKSYTFNWDGKSRHKLTFKLQSNSVVKIRLQASLNEFSSYRPSMRASIFKSNGENVVINNHFNDSLYGIFVKAQLPSGEYILLMERFESGDGDCVVEIGCDHSLQLDTLA